MFDLLVTYARGEELTYKSIVKTLHILDYEYFLKATDMLFNSNMAGALILFDEILRKGFDGHHFINGLCEHFRNLMICKDEAIIQLLNVSEDVKENYREQARSTSLSFLLSAINIANQCDAQYKNSKSQRLQVELALMKMSNLNKAFDLAKLIFEKKK